MYNTTDPDAFSARDDVAWLYLNVQAPKFVMFSPRSLETSAAKEAASYLERGPRPFALVESHGKSPEISVRLKCLLNVER